jgi:hypothetical protein
MKGIDYTKQLRKEREYFQDTVKKTQESAEKRIADTDERAESIMSKQRNNFIEDKADLESSYQKNIEGLNEKTRGSLENNNDNFFAEREKERESFTQDSIAKRKDFDQRLSDIKSSYQKSFESERDTNKDLQTTSKTKYDKSINDTRSHSDKQLLSYRDEMSGQGASLKDQYKRERQQLVRSQEDLMTDTFKDAAHKRAELKDHLRNDLKKSKEVQAGDLEQQKIYTDDRMSTMQNKFQDRSQKMARDYSQRSDKLVESQHQDSIKTNRENQNALTDVRRDYNKQLRLVDLDKRRRDNGSGEFSEIMDRQQGLKDATLNDNRFDDLKENMSVKQKVYEDKAIKDQDSFNETLKTENAEGTARLDRKLNEATADKIMTVSKEREKAEGHLAVRETQNRNNITSHEQQLTVERDNAKNRLTNLKENFNKSMKQLEEKNRLEIDDVTKVTNEDKAGFVKNLTAARNKETFEMKREFARLMDQTVQDYEQRLGNYQRDNEFLKMTMDQKVSNITDQTQKQLESQSTLFEARHTADLKNTQVQMDQREHHWKTASNQTSLNLQKKIDRMQVEGDTKLKLLTNEYENKLKELKAMTSKELAQKDSTHQIELSRIKDTYAGEKTRVISAYETQIESIKTGHKEQMDSMQDYKRLS